MKRRTRTALAGLACATALALAGCGGNDGGEETLSIPQLRIGGPNEELLTLAATTRIERRREDGVLASENLQREIWVRSRVDDSEACERLGQTRAITDDDKLPPGGFVLEVNEPPDMPNPALALLAGLDAENEISLLVLWSVPGTDTNPDPVLLDAAEYRLVIAGPTASETGESEMTSDAATDEQIFLEPQGPLGEDGSVTATLIEEAIPCEMLATRTRDADSDGVESLDELNAGLPLDDVVGVEGSVPLTIDDEVDVVVVAGRGDRMTGEPLTPTWRLFRSTAPDGLPGGELKLQPTMPDGMPPTMPDGNRGPLDLRIATSSDGSMLVEAAFPAGYDTSEGGLTMEVLTDDLEGSFDCLEGVTVMLPDVPASDGAPTGTPSEGAYLDASRGSLMLTVRCDSKAFMPSGRLSLSRIRVMVSRGDEPTVDEVWELQGLEVFVHDESSSPGPMSRP